MSKSKRKHQLKTKPSYYLYLQLGHTLNYYLKSKMPEYIFFQYFGGNNPNINIVKQLSMKEFRTLKAIYEYDYKVFKLFLFLYGDYEKYLESTDYVKYTLKTDDDNEHHIILKFKKEIINDEIFLDKIYSKKPTKFGANIEIKGIMEDIFKYDIYSKIETLDTKYKDESYISIYRSYKKHNDTTLSSGLIEYIKLIQNQEIPPSYYRSYIEDGHKEGSTEHKKYSAKKYKEKILDVSSELNNLILTFCKP